MSPSWVPLPRAGLKINCDGSFSLFKGKASVGIIARNSEGRLVDGIGKSIPVISALSSEAWAIREVCFMIQAYGWREAIYS